MPDRDLHRELKRRTEPLEPGELTNARAAVNEAIEAHRDPQSSEHPQKTLSRIRRVVKRAHRVKEIFKKTSQN